MSYITINLQKICSYLQKRVYECNQDFQALHHLKIDLPKQDLDESKKEILQFKCFMQFNLLFKASLDEIFNFIEYFQISSCRY